MQSNYPTIPNERIVSKILLIRGEKVVLDSDLANFYGVKTGELIQAVSRNADRFPGDFMFQLTLEETRRLKKELRVGRAYGGRRTFPYAFTEHGVAMLSAVLKSTSAVAVSVQIVRSFIQLRKLLLSNETLARKVRALEEKTDEHAKVIVQIINELHEPTTPKTRRIGF